MIDSHGNLNVTDDLPSILELDELLIEMSDILQLITTRYNTDSIVIQSSVLSCLSIVRLLPHSVPQHRNKKTEDRRQKRRQKTA